MSCHLAHKIPWDCLAECLTVYKGAVSLPVGECGRIHSTDKKLEYRKKYINDSNVCYDNNCETCGFETFSKNRILSKEIDSRKGPLSKYQRNKLKHFCRKFTTVLNEFVNTEALKKEDISNLENCNLNEFVDRTIPCTECYGYCDDCKGNVCKKYVVFNLFMSGRIDVLLKLHELNRIDIYEALTKNYGGQAVGNGYAFLIIYHLLPFYLESNAIIQLGYQNDPSKWGSLNPNGGYLYRDLMSDCDFKTFIPSLRNLLSPDTFMKDTKATQTLLKEVFRCIYQYVYLMRKFKLRDPLEPRKLLQAVQYRFGLSYKNEMDLVD